MFDIIRKLTEKAKQESCEIEKVQEVQKGKFTTEKVGKFHVEKVGKFVKQQNQTGVRIQQR